MGDGAPTTTGRSLDRRIWTLAGPAVLTLASEPLYQLADTAIVGRIGPEALGGLAVASSLLLFATGMLVFLTFGTAATVARLLGAGRRDDAAEQSVQALWLGFGLGLVVAVVLALAADPLLDLFGADAGVVADARTYLVVNLWGLPAATVALAGTGALRGHLDTRTPLVVAVGSNSLNVGLTAFLVLGLDRGIGAAALATVVARIAAAVAYSVIVVRRARRRGVTLRPVPERLRSLAVVGRDLFLRTVALRSALTVTVALAARKGTIALAAFQIAFQWWGFLAYMLDALEAAAQSLVANALGGGDRVLARTTARRILAWAVLGGVVLGALTALAARPIASIFTEDEAVLTLAATSLVWVGCIQPVNGAAFALDGILVGAGDQRFLAGAMLMSLGVLLAGAPLAGRSDVGLWGLWLLMGVFMATRVAVLGVRYRGPRWERVGAA